jgi:hypothetical protein
MYALPDRQKTGIVKVYQLVGEYDEKNALIWLQKEV